MLTINFPARPTTLLINSSTRQTVAPTAPPISPATPLVAPAVPYLRPYFQGFWGSAAVGFFSAPKGCGYYYAEEEINSGRKLQQKHDEIKKLPMSNTAKELAMTLVTIQYLHPRAEMPFKKAAFEQHCKKAVRLITKINLDPLYNTQNSALGALEKVKSTTSGLDTASKTLEKASNALNKLSKSTTDEGKLKPLRAAVVKAQEAVDKAQTRADQARSNYDNAQKELSKIYASKKEILSFLTQGMGLTKKKFQWTEVRGDADPDELLGALKAGATAMANEIKAIQKLKAALERANPRHIFG